MKPHDTSSCKLTNSGLLELYDRVKDEKDPIGTLLSEYDIYNQLDNHFFSQKEPSFITKDIIFYLCSSNSYNFIEPHFDILLNLLKHPLLRSVSLCKCINPKNVTQAQCYQILEILSQVPSRRAQNTLLDLCYSVAGNQIIKEYIQRMNENGEFYYEILPDLKTVYSYTGMTNIGTTCFLNSILQQLSYSSNFMLYFMRERLSGINLILQGLFMRLHYSILAGVDTTEFVAEWLKQYSQRLNVLQQHDAYEFFQLLLECINIKEIQNIFTGQIENLIENDDKRIETIAEYFTGISLEVQENNTLNESLQKFSNPVNVEGTNQRKTLKFKSLPNTLVIHLKRFKYSEKVEKINSYFSYPDSFTLENIKYNIKGVVLHAGTPESGHYTSLIFRDGHWLFYNDSSVSEVNNEGRKKMSFGGTNVPTNAYILFYERADLPYFDLDCPLIDDYFGKITEENYKLSMQSLITCETYSRIAIDVLGDQSFIKYFFKIFLRSRLSKMKKAVARFESLRTDSMIIENADYIAKAFVVADQKLLESLKIEQMLSSESTVPLMRSFMNEISKRADDQKIKLMAETLAAFLKIHRHRFRVDFFVPLVDAVSDVFKQQNHSIRYYRFLQMSPLFESISYLLESSDVDRIWSIIKNKDYILLSPGNIKGFDQMVVTLGEVMKQPKERPLSEQLLDIEDENQIIDFINTRVADRVELLRDLIQLVQTHKNKIERVAPHAIIPFLFSHDQKVREQSSRLCLALLPSIPLCKSLLAQIIPDSIFLERECVSFFATLYRSLKDSSFPQQNGPLKFIQNVYDKGELKWSAPLAEVIRLGLYFEDTSDIARDIWRAVVDLDNCTPREEEYFLNFLVKNDEKLLLEAVFADVSSDTVMLFKARGKALSRIKITEEWLQCGMIWFSTLVALLPELQNFEDVITATYYILPQLDDVVPSEVDPETVVDIIDHIKKPKRLLALNSFFLQIDVANGNRAICCAAEKRKTLNCIALLTLEEVRKHNPDFNRLISLKEASECAPCESVPNQFFAILLDELENNSTIFEFIKHTFVSCTFANDFESEFYLESLKKMKSSELQEILPLFKDMIVTEDSPKFSYFIQKTLLFIHRFPRLRNLVISYLPFDFDKLLEYANIYISN